MKRTNKPQRSIFALCVRVRRWMQKKNKTLIVLPTMNVWWGASTSISSPRKKIAERTFAKRVWSQLLFQRPNALFYSYKRILSLYKALICQIQAYSGNRPDCSKPYHGYVFTISIILGLSVSNHRIILLGGGIY